VVTVRRSLRELVVADGGDELCPRLVGGGEDGSVVVLGVSDLLLTGGGAGLEAVALDSAVGGCPPLTVASSGCHVGQCAM
jgi:hypothetical protein